MTDFQRPEGWSDADYDAYFGEENDPMDAEPVSEEGETLDLYALYDPSAFEAGDDSGTVA